MAELEAEIAGRESEVTQLRAQLAGMVDVESSVREHAEERIARTQAQVGRARVCSVCVCVRLCVRAWDCVCVCVCVLRLYECAYASEHVCSCVLLPARPLAAQWGEERMHNEA